MLVECLIEREGSTHVNLGGHPYEFKDDGTGHKVCTVNSAAHEHFFLSTPYYREYTPDRGKVVESLPDLPRKGKKCQASRA